MHEAKKVLPVVVVTLVFFFLFRHLHRNWQNVTEYEWTINYWFLGLSTVTVLIAFVCTVLAWRLILSSLGGTLSFGKAWRIFFVSALGRYVPGKIWQMLGMIYLCGREGVSTDKSVSSAIAAQILNTMSGLIISLLAVGPVVRSLGRGSWALLCVLPVGFAALSPPVMRRITMFLSKRFGKGTVQFQMSLKDTAAFVGLYLLSWIAYGGAFFLFINSVAHLSASIAIFLTFTGIFAAAYVAGLMVVFVPGGLGVREGVMALLLGNFFPLPVAAAISVASRVWLTCAELLGLGLSLKLK